MGTPAAGVEAGAVSARGPAAKVLRPPPGEDFWVFGYGSLMWHPGFPHLEVRPAHLYGYHRHFCVFFHFYRGTKACPGLVLGLDRGGSCHGLAYRVPAAESEDVVAYLHEREMTTYAYDSRWLRLRTRNGPIVAVALGDHVDDPVLRQAAGVLLVAAVDRKGDGGDRALAGSQAQPARIIGVGRHFALVQVGHHVFGLRRRHPVRQAMTGAAPVEAEHQPGTLLGAAVAVGENAEMPVIAVEVSRTHLQVWETRVPHQRAVAKHPKVLARRRAQELGGRHTRAAHRPGLHGRGGR